MKLLITGGTGFIGSRLAFEARSRGYDLVLAGRANTQPEAIRRAELETAGFVVHDGPLQDPAFAERVVAGCEAVIHLAAAQHEAGASDAYFREVNVGATRALLEASAKAGITRFVYGSTIGVYGAVQDAVITEGAPTRPENIYGLTKLEAEAVVKSYANRMEVTIARISEAYGPGDWRLLKVFKAVDRGLCLVIGGGVNLHQPIHVQDLARGLLLAAEHPAAAGQTFILAGAAPLTTRAMIEHIADALEQPHHAARIPLWPLKTAACLMEAVCKPFGVTPPLHRRRLDFFEKSFRFSTERAMKLLGFQAVTPFASGARDAANWYRSRGLLGERRPAATAQSANDQSPASSDPDAHTDVAITCASRHTPPPR